ncbi:MAG: ArnT family glycosyltransferase [Candidatus Acidiferrales bacterium]
MISEPSADKRKSYRYQFVLLLIFIVSLPLLNPWVRGDGVGYYAYARSILIEHKLDFRQDWLRANASFRMDRIDTDGKIAPSQYTVTGHLDNHFSIGPAILWSPFLVLAHAGVLLWDRFGGHVAADGFSRPYLLAMSFGTAFYGFLALVISFGLARRFVPERWAFLATLGVWFASSLPVYMYFNPSWSHAQSAFTVALFVWYWLRTRGKRRLAQWILLGVLGGVMMDVYYPNVFLLLFPAFESLAFYWTDIRQRCVADAAHLFLKNLAFIAALVGAFLPTLITKKIIYGSYFETGYDYHWHLNSPAFFQVCFSSDHGLFAWTPILILSIAGLVLLQRYDRRFGWYSLCVFAAFLYFIGCYPDWDGLSSFGNRFFITLTPLFIIGLSVCFDGLVRWLRDQRAAVVSVSVTTAFVLWNFGLIFQWGMHLVPPRGPISWREAAYNQVAVVPQEATSALKDYFLRRASLMQQIERNDVNQLKSQQEHPAE